ncbi:MAG: translation initiation factor IF-3 [Candidatus Levyibacteriota bacterium]|nr:MAG: translation initiation factor IF-3 [Candidatus Levybacteria bacterium]
MIRRFKKHNQRQQVFRINERIFAVSLRVLDSEGKQIGILNRFEALQKARNAGLDLVEIAPSAKPPVAKIVDFKKFLYQEAKKKKEEKKKAKVPETKEIRLGPFMNNHDLDVMVRRARTFLENGDKVKLVVKFVGRQITHPEFGKDITKKSIDHLSDISKIEREMKFEGKNLITILSPEKKRNKHEEENTKVSLKTV